MKNESYWQSLIPEEMSATTKKPNACEEKHDKVKQKHCGAVF